MQIRHQEKIMHFINQNHLSRYFFHAYQGYCMDLNCQNKPYYHFLKIFTIKIFS